jgi:hypothetical protein
MFLRLGAPLRQHLRRALGFLWTCAVEAGHDYEGLGGRWMRPSRGGAQRCAERRGEADECRITDVVELLTDRGIRRAMLRGHNAVIHTTPKWACQRIKEKKTMSKNGSYYTLDREISQVRQCNGQFATRGCMELRT